MLLALALGGVVAPPAAAWDAWVDASVRSRYLWRGMLINDRPVLQPALTVTEGGLETAVWASFDLTSDWDRRLEYTEIDVSASYSLGLDETELTFTAYRYVYSDPTVPPTTELWASVQLPTVLEPRLTVVRDVDVVKGTYYLLEVSQPLGLLAGAVSEGLALGLSVGHGDRSYTRGYFPDGGAATVTDYSVRLEWAVTVGSGELTLDLQQAGFTSADVMVEGFEGERSSFVCGVTYSLPIRF